MADLSPAQRRLFRIVAAITGILALALIALVLVGVTDLPLFLPVLLLVSAGGLLLAAAPRSR